MNTVATIQFCKSCKAAVTRAEVHGAAAFCWEYLFATLGCTSAVGIHHMLGGFIV
jgi:hypothetical protein